jgi:periplasmic protein TonB
MQVRIAQQNRIGGWGFSLLLHGILLSAIWPLFHHLPIPTLPEPFRWDVTFVELPQQGTADQQTSDASAENELIPTEKTIEPTHMPLLRNLPSPAQQATNDVNETIQAPNLIRPTRAVPAPPTSSTAGPAPAIEDTQPLQRNVAEQPRTILPATPVPLEPSTPVSESVGQEIPPPAQALADVATALPQSYQPAQAPATSVSPIASDRPPVALADYGWLQRALSRRLEELKRFSHPSLDDSSKLKVLVKAVVSDRGELMEAEVVKSSGSNRIDQEAMTLVERAFPMAFDQTLDRPKIVMRIPITYSRD